MIATTPNPPSPDDAQVQPRRRRRWRWKAALAGVLLVSIGVTVWAVPHFVGRGADVESPLIGHPPPPFQLEDLQDPSVTVRVGPSTGKPTVVNFWASWCVPCRRELPTLERIRTEFSGCVDFVGVDHADTRSDTLRLMADTGVRYRSGFDPNGQVATAYGLIGLPSTVVVTADDVVHWVHLGAVEKDQLRGQLEHLGAKSGC